MVAFDVLMMGAGVSAQSVVNAVDAFSDLGHVYLLPPVAAVVQDEGETAGVTAHHLRIHVPHDEAIAALDTMHAYRELVLPQAFIVVEVAKINVVVL